MSAKSIDSGVICYPLSLHKRVGEYGDETRTWFWRDLVVTERWCFLSVEGNSAPVKNLHIHQDYCCHLLCSLMSSNINRGRLFVVSMFTSMSSLAVADHFPHCVKAASHFSLRDCSNQPNVTWWGPPPIRLHWVNMDYHRNVIRNRCTNRLPNQNRLSY